MLRSLAILLVLVLAGETCRVHAVTVPRLVSKLALKNAAFLDLVSVPGFSPALAATTFTGNPFVGGAVDVIEDIASVKNLSSAKLTQLTTKMNWPNDVTAVPEGAVEGFAGLSVGYGFLVPGKSIGGVGLVSYPDGAFTKITKDDGNPLNGGYFYHKVVWMDMDDDGLLDAVTARATKPIIGSSNGQFLWLKQPADSPLSSTPWEATQLSSGHNSPDILFSACDLNDDGETEFVYASFFTGAGLGLAYKDPSATSWTPESFHYMSIDDSIGPAFATQVVDMNGDGRKDVLISNHVNNAAESGVWVYEAPQKPNPLNDTSLWIKHKIAGNFTVLTKGIGQAAPGAAFAYRPSISTGGKYSVIVGGDGAEGVYIITPDSEDPSDWSYTKTEVDNCHGTVGQVAVGDTNGDGFTDIFVPCYDIGELHQLTFAP